MIKFAKRASSIIYNFLRSNDAGNKKYLLPANVCPIVPLTFLKAGTQFEFVDINPATLCMDFAIVISRLRNMRDKYAGVLFVPTYGVNTSFEEYFIDIKNIDDNLIIINDKALCVPETELVFNTNSDILLFSTGYAKVLDIGFGGYAFIKESYNYSDFNLKYEEHDLKKLYEYYNLKLYNREQLLYEDSNWLDINEPKITFFNHLKKIKTVLKQVLDKKKAINEFYKNNLPNDIQLNDKFNIWRFNVLVENKELLLKTIFNEGLFASSHYQSLGGIFSEDRFPLSEELHSKVINLFNDKYFDMGKAEKITNIINKHNKKYHGNNVQ